MKAGEAPGGEASGTMGGKSTSTKTRGQRKAETQAAKMNGQLEPAGEQAPNAGKTKQ